MVEFMDKDASYLLIGERGKEVGVPIEGDIVVLHVEGNACRGQVHGWDLADVA